MGFVPFVTDFVDLTRATKMPLSGEVLSPLRTTSQAQNLALLASTKDIVVHTVYLAQSIIRLIGCRARLRALAKPLDANFGEIIIGGESMGIGSADL